MCKHVHKKFLTDGTSPLMENKMANGSKSTERLSLQAIVKGGLSKANTQRVCIAELVRQKTGILSLPDHGFPDISRPSLIVNVELLDPPRNFRCSHNRSLYVLELLLAADRDKAHKYKAA